MLNQDWEDAFQELWNHAAHHRGLREGPTDASAHAFTEALRQWPRTCGADVVAIASIIDTLLRAAPLASGVYGVERGWRRCAHEMAGAGLGEPGLEYRHNRDFWSTLASTIAYLASVDVAVPESMWRALLAELAAPPPPRHSTAVVDERLHLTAFSYAELWQAQKAAMAKLRGSDVHEAGPNGMGGQMTIPRTTNTDVLQIATYWTNALAQVEIKRRHTDVHGGIALHSLGLDGAIRRWRVTLGDIDSHATTGDPAATYLKNEAFWRVSASIAATVSVIDDAPPPFEMLLDAKVQRPEIHNLYRNATYPGEGNFENKWDQTQKDAIEAHGFDTRDALPGRVGRPMKIPRTTNEEIVKLATYWNAAWKKLEDKRGTFGSLSNEQGLDTLKKRWLDVMKDVHASAETGKAEDAYAKNNEFWRESFELAQSLDLFNELPSKLDIAWGVAQEFPERVADVVGKLAHAVGDIAHKAGEGITSGLGKDILIAGGVVVGGVLLWRWIRPSVPAIATAAV